MSVITEIEASFKKPQVAQVQSGDTVRVHQRIREGKKTRIQVFEGMVIRTKRSGSHTSAIVVRRIASGIGVEKSYLLNSPLIEKVEVTKRSKVRRNYLSYMRQRQGKATRLSGIEFDRDKVNVSSVAEEQPNEKAAEPAESKIDEAPTPKADTEAKTEASAADTAA